MVAELLLVIEVLILLSIGLNVMEKREEMVNTCCSIFACSKTTNIL